MSAEKQNRVPSTAEGGMNVTPGRQDEHKVYEREPGRASAGAGHPGGTPGGPLVTGISEASKGSATGQTARAEDEDEQ